MVCGDRCAQEPGTINNPDERRTTARIHEDEIHTGNERESHTGTGHNTGEAAMI